MWAQVVGKVRLALEPALNHTWQAPLYVSARGLTNYLMPYGGRGMEMEFYFHRHVLDIRTRIVTSRRFENLRLVRAKTDSPYFASLAGLLRTAQAKPTDPNATGLE